MTRTDIDKMKCVICRKWFWDQDVSLENETDRKKIIKFHQTSTFHKHAEKNLHYVESDKKSSGHKPTAKSVQMAINFNKEIME